MIYPDLSSMSQELPTEFNELDEFMGRNSSPSCDSVKIPDISHKKLRDITVKHILENFKKIGKPGLYDRDSMDEDDLKRNSLRYSLAEHANWSINIEDIHKLVKMCGGDLDKFESFYLLKRSNYGSQRVSFASWLTFFIRGLTAHEMSQSLTLLMLWRAT
jgi:hypothetical protein